jgi:ribosome-binding ATPase YchF (GTP1/OBG family)
MSEEKITDNKWKYILAGGSLIAASFVGYYLWKKNSTEKTSEDKTNEETKVFNSLKETENKNQEYLGFYQVNGKKFHTKYSGYANIDHFFLTKKEIVKMLNLLETKGPNDQEIINFEKELYKKIIPFSLLGFLEVDSKDFSSSETFFTICKYLTEPRVIKSLVLDDRMNSFRTATNLLDFHPQSSELETLTYELIKEHRLLL